jgi:hypothetical protein
MTGRNVYWDVGNGALTDAHLGRKYISKWEFSNENFKFEALIKRLAFANPFSVTIRNIIIIKLLEFSIFYANRWLVDFHWLNYIKTT